ncbi:MAG: tryptophan--tRNA ligase [Chloracidobacterium sp.]|nr:tryptophan--tRNA ligase [Chloracidobacterium sp.]
MKKRIFSGAQPTGDLHIGNYLGALRNWVELQDEYESFYCIVNLHAITLPQAPKVLRQKTLDLARIYLAAGVDPEKATIFIQSDVPEHAELTWVLSCVARMGELERMTQFKDKTQKGTPNTGLPQLADLLNEYDRGRIDAFASKEPDPRITELLFGSLRDTEAQKSVARASVGLFTYPVLMAADILLYQTDLVPVGKDQKQHLELTRDLSERFNRDFGETFKIPEPYIPPVGANVLSLQDSTKKMSKSDENVNGSIFLLDDADTITKKVKRAVTDSGTEINFDETRPAIKNLLTIYQLLTGKSAEECVAHFEGKGYGQFKGELAEVTVEFLRPFQEKIKQYDDTSLTTILKTGAEKARSVAASTLTDVYNKTGIK